MNSYKNKFIYWTLLTHANWKFHIAATESGLCFIGSQDEQFEELNIWARKKLPQYILIHSPDYLQVYTKEIIEYLKTREKLLHSLSMLTELHFNYLFGIRYVKFLMGKHILIQKLQIEFKTYSGTCRCFCYCCQPNSHYDSLPSCYWKEWQTNWF